MTIASDVMQVDVVTVRDEEPLLNVFRVLVEENISGVPVLDARDDLVGVVSSRDLVRCASEERDEAREDLHYYACDSSFQEDREWLSDIADFEDRLSRRSVAEVMTTDVISVSADTPIADVAALLLKHRIHRVLVTDDENDEGPLIGLVSAFDLIRLLC